MILFFNRTNLEKYRTFLRVKDAFPIIASQRHIRVRPQRHGGGDVRRLLHDRHERLLDARPTGRQQSDRVRACDSILLIICLSDVAFSSMSKPNFAANGAREDVGFLNFDVSVDFSPVFNWNVKQLFLYLVAEYETERNVCNKLSLSSIILNLINYQDVNEVVIWDKIIKRTDKQVLDLKNLNPKYYFFDDGSFLRYVYLITVIIN